MAEEKHEQKTFIASNNDDIRALEFLLQNVRGLRHISGSPLDVALEE